METTRTMKAMGFHLMPYRDPPNDFTPAHEWVGADVERQLFDAALIGECFARAGGWRQ